MHEIISGLSDAFTLSNCLFIVLGVLLGQLITSLPGVGPVIAITIAVPYTYYMNPVVSIGFLIGMNKGGTVGGAVSAVLMNTPGSPEATVTAFDGYPMTLKGQARKALRTAHLASVTGDVFGDLALFFIAAPMSLVAMKMGPPEMASVILMALVVISGLVGESMIKGLIAAFFGIFLSLVGMDSATAAQRFTFGVPELMNGLSITAVGIGMLALGEIFRQVVYLKQRDGKTPEIAPLDKGEPFRFADYKAIFPTIMRSSFIGVLIGVIPGVGASAASLLSYMSTKRVSKNPENFGKGEIRGVAAAEAANSSVIGGSFIPLLALGIPGNVATAIILGAFVIHGITPGPQIISEHPHMVYGLFGVMLLGDVANLVVGLFTVGLFAKIVRIPMRFIIPCVMLLCVTGVVVSGSLFDAWMLLGMAALGFFMRMLNFSFITFIIGFILGPMFERSLRQALILANDSPVYLLHRPIACLFIALSIFLLISLVRQHRKSGGVDLMPD